MATEISPTFTHCRECEGKVLSPSRDSITWLETAAGDRENGALAVACLLQHPGVEGLHATIAFDGESHVVKDARLPGDSDASTRARVEEALRRHGLAVVREPDRIQVKFIGGDLAQRAAIRRALDEGLWDSGSPFDIEIDVGLWDDGATPVMVVSALRHLPAPSSDVRKDVSDVLAKRGFRTAAMPSA